MYIFFDNPALAEQAKLIAMTLRRAKVRQYIAVLLGIR
jgi:hypothetical protein